MLRRHELTDPKSILIGDRLPPPAYSESDLRTAPEGISRILHTGGRRRELPGRHGDRKRLYDRFRRRRPSGTTDRILA